MNIADQGLPTHYCSFCGQYYEEAEFFIMGPDVSICSDCADLCTEFLKEWREDKKTKNGVGE